MSGARDRLRVIVVSVSPEVVARKFGLADVVDVVGSASGAEDALDQVEATAASVATVDMAQPASVAIETIRKVAPADPPIGIVALAASPLDRQVVSAALEAGAHACATTLERIGGALPSGTSALTVTTSKDFVEAVRAEAGDGSVVTVAEEIASDIKSSLE